MPLWEVALTAFVPLITMVNPLAVVPPFLALTDGPLRARRREVAFVAGLGTIAFLTFFLLAGNFIIKVMALLLGAIGIQFVLNGIKPVIVEIMRAAG